MSKTYRHAVCLPLIYTSNSQAEDSHQIREGGALSVDFAEEGGAPAPKALPLPTPLTQTHTQTHRHTNTLPYTSLAHAHRGIIIA